MRKLYKKLFVAIAVAAIALPATAQNNFFTDAGQNKTIASTGKRAIIPGKFRTVSMDYEGIRKFLWDLPSENQLGQQRAGAQIMELPMPDGSMAKFRVWESSIMEAGLAAKFPDMKQFLGQGIDDPYASIRFDFNPYTGFHAQVLSAKTGRFFIDPYANGDRDNYISYFGRDARSPERFICNTEAESSRLDYPSNTQTEAACLGGTLRTYRLAVACTGEYSVAVNGPNPTTAGVAAAILTAITRLTGVYEEELSIRFKLVANNDLLIYLDGTSDPYTNNNGSTMLGQNQTNITNIIQAANYDIGHVFSTGGGGVATLASVCNDNTKARGVTGRGNPVGDPFVIDYVAHEVGHQFGGLHTFNSVTSNCGGGNRSGGSAYEPGSGTTIMAYAGICGSDDIQPNSDPYFHSKSFDEISIHVNSTSCAATSATGNTLPVIAALPNNGITIPVSTPFTLTGTATDADNDPLTYSWEQMDLSSSGTWNSGATSTAAPIFKARVPKTTGSRTFPDMAVILAGYPANPPAAMGGLKGEVLPTVARTLNFRLTVRDNRTGGGAAVSSGTTGCQSSSAFVVNVAGTTPFAVTVPNGGESYAGGSSQTITWNNAATNAAPFNVANVKITLSTDGGQTYPIVIAASTPNDGSETITMPANITSTARIRIEAIGNIFFDISNANFSLTAVPVGFSFDSPGPVTAACPTPATVSATLKATYTGGHTSPITLTSTVAPAGPMVTITPATLTTTTTSAMVSITNANTLAPGNYTVTVTGTSTGAPTQTRQIVFTITSSTPTITMQPANQSACLGTNTSFNVSSPDATGYQWQVNTGSGFTNITNAAPYSGATTNTLMISSVTAAMNNYKYRVVASTICGNTTSAEAALTVVIPATITTQPAGLTICEGANTSFSVVATAGSGTLAYQWQFSSNAGASWTNIAGATNASFTQTAVPVGQNGYHFRVIISAGCGSVTSGHAILTVNAYPVIGFETAAVVCMSDEAFALTATPIGGAFSGAGVSGGNFTPSAAGVGVATVTYTATNGTCAASASRIIAVNECAERHLRLNEFPATVVYPVPNSGNFNIRLNTDLYTKIGIRLFNSAGQLMKSQDASGLRYGSVIPVNATNLPTGVYQVYMYSDERGGSSKAVSILIQK